jgi:integrase
MADVAAKYLRNAHERHLRPTTILNRAGFAKWVVKHYGPFFAESFPPGEIVRTSRRKSLSRALDLRAMLRWAYTEEHICRDPTLRVRLPLPPRRKISYLSVLDVERYFAAVPAPYKAAFALAIYAGLRPYEVCRAQWKHIEFGEQMRVHVPEENAKVGPSRTIEAEEILLLRIPRLDLEIERGRLPGLPRLLWEILEPLRGAPEDYILPTTCRGGIPRDIIRVAVPTWIRVRAQAAIDSGVVLSSDEFRHTLLTYLIALTQNIGLAAKIAGHSDLTMLRKHYDGVATRAAGTAFFRLPPVVRTQTTDLSPEAFAMLFVGTELERRREAAAATERISGASLIV